jgi:hypothetical protein
MSRFADSIVGGIGTLIRQYIRSADYVPNVSGWTINKDGSAEFNNLTIRGTVVLDGSNGIFVYDGVPGAGNLMLSISSQAGVDPYGNVYPKGMMLKESSTLGGPVGKIQWDQPTAVNRTPAYIQAYIPSTNHFLSIVGPTLNPDGASIVLSDIGEIIMQSTRRLSLAGHPVQVNLSDFQVDSGPPGQYYSEEASYPATLCNNGATTQLVQNSIVKSSTDYGSAFFGNQWTCPVDSWYDVTVAVEFTANAGSNGRLRLSLSSGALETGTIYYRDTRSFLAATPVGAVFTIHKWFNVGDPVFVNVNQNSGGALTTSTAVNNHMTFARAV